MRSWLADMARCGVKKYTLRSKSLTSLSSGFLCSFPQHPAIGSRLCHFALITETCARHWTSTVLVILQKLSILYCWRRTQHMRDIAQTKHAIHDMLSVDLKWDLLEMGRNRRDLRKYSLKRVLSNESPGHSQFSMKRTWGSSRFQKNHILGRNQKIFRLALNFRLAPVEGWLTKHSVSTPPLSCKFSAAQRPCRPFRCAAARQPRTDGMSLLAQAIPSPAFLPPTRLSHPHRSHAQQLADSSRISSHCSDLVLPLSIRPL